MSTSCGACGVFGILLTDSKIPAVAEIVKQLNEAVATYEPEDGEEFDCNTPEDYPKVEALVDPLKKAFEDNGIVLPDGIDLQWTGSEDDQPARCDTAAEQWVLGFGLFTDRK